MEQPMFSLASYHGERKLAWKRICNIHRRKFVKICWGKPANGAELPKAPTGVGSGLGQN